MQKQSDFIAFLSGFGLDSRNPGIVRAVIYGIHSRAAIVDLAHSIPPFDMEIAGR